MWWECGLERYIWVSFSHANSQRKYARFRLNLTPLAVDMIVVPSGRVVSTTKKKSCQTNLNATHGRVCDCRNTNLAQNELCNLVERSKYYSLLARRFSQKCVPRKLLVWLVSRLQVTSNEDMFWYAMFYWRNFQRVLLPVGIRIFAFRSQGNAKQFETSNHLNRRMLTQPRLVAPISCR